MLRPFVLAVTVLPVLAGQPRFGVAVLFALVATLAALLPAHRATRVDPLVALRNE